ncbi:hypothetical protein O9992_09625 [Vibrio lentus]|nr:hypothetical protein [Vibrio lentus]
MKKRNSSDALGRCCVRDILSDSEVSGDKGRNVITCSLWYASIIFIREKVACSTVDVGDM